NGFLAHAIRYKDHGPVLSRRLACAVLLCRATPNHQIQAPALPKWLWLVVIQEKAVTGDRAQHEQAGAAAAIPIDRSAVDRQSSRFRRQPKSRRKHAVAHARG